MKPPNETTALPEQQPSQAQQPPAPQPQPQVQQPQPAQPPAAATDTTMVNPTGTTTTTITPPPIINKLPVVAPSQAQQVPLKLTTQPQNQFKPQTQTTSVASQPPEAPAPTPTQGLSSTPTPAPATTPTQAHQPIISTPIQIQAPIVTSVPNIIPIPLAAHQQPVALVQQPALAKRPPSTLPIVPITTATSASIKSEPNKYVCCLLDNGVRCDRVAGNASFSARIQKIVGTKKMNFVLDPTVRHAYICEHHKAIITVAKKSTPLARDTKLNSKSYTANNNNAMNAIASHQNSNFNDLSIRQQQSLQHPVNLELINQNRLVNNHTGVFNSMPVRQGAPMNYAHYQGPHPNQIGQMDVMMPSSYNDNMGGDSLPSSSGGVDVDLQQLQVNTLRRYKRHFRVQTRPGLNKMQLAESLKSHFKTLPIIEKEAITYFVYIVKCYRNKLDHNPKAD